MQGLLVLTAHLVGDFVIQNDWMAAGKKKSSAICLIHVVTYLAPFFLTGLQWWQVVLIGVQHFFQDRTNFIPWFLESSGKGDFAKPPMAPWSIIAVDNTFHLAWIVAVIITGA